MKRFIVELGMGADLHGGDVTKAVKRAMKDAISHSCLCGLQEVLDDGIGEHISVHVKVACPHPDQVDVAKLQGVLPIGKTVIDEICEGGMSTTGLHVDALGAGNQIVVALISLTVVVEE